MRTEDGESMTKMINREWDEDVMKAFEELERLSKDPNMREQVLNREIGLRDNLTRLAEAEDRGIEKGLILGIEQGERSMQLEIAKKLKELGIGLATIVIVWFSVKKKDKLNVDFFNL